MLGLLELEPTWHTPSDGDGRKAGLPMVKLPTVPRSAPSRRPDVSVERQGHPHWRQNACSSSGERLEPNPARARPGGAAHGRTAQAREEPCADREGLGLATRDRLRRWRPLLRQDAYTRSGEPASPVTASQECAGLCGRTGAGLAAPPCALSG